VKWCLNVPSNGAIALMCLAGEGVQENGHLGNRYKPGSSRGQGGMGHRANGESSVMICKCCSHQICAFLQVVMACVLISLRQF
jgi:hypothetical protein